MQNLLNDIQQTVDIGAEELTKVTGGFQSVTFKKGESVPVYGKVVHHFKFIASGLLRVYFIDQQAKETTIQIGSENTWISDLHSFLTQTACQYHIDVLENTTILKIHRSDLEHLFHEVPAMEKFFRLKVQRAYCALQDRTLHQMNKSAEERYLTFQKSYGHLENRVPQYMIASYLNLSPEHLSKVKNKLNRSSFLNLD